MANDKLRQWELRFRRAAKADKYAILRDHLRNLGLPDSPELLIEGTVRLVQACAAYASIDGQSFAKFLAMQHYDPDDAEDAEYVFTFDLCGKAFARVLVGGTKFDGLDLADLYGHPWWDYKVCGYHTIWISRSDGSDLDPSDMGTLEQEVTDDFLYDYSEDEIDLWFSSATEGTLMVGIQDREKPYDDSESAKSGTKPAP